jgi:rubrerythrin
VSDIKRASIISPQRRQLLKLGALTGATGAFALVAGNGGFAFAGARSRPNPKADAEIINGVIILEQKAVNTYLAAAENNLLPTKAFLDVAVEFANDHTNHRDRLKRAVSQALRRTPPDVSKVGTFPIPKNVLSGKEADVLRYALTLEMIAAKSYLDSIQNKLTTDEAKDIAATIMPVETMHVAIFRTVLMTMLKEKGLPGDNKLVPYSFLDQEKMPPLPQA